jgi:hypothetical protein
MITKTPIRHKKAKQPGLDFVPGIFSEHKNEMNVSKCIDFETIDKKKSPTEKEISKNNMYENPHKYFVEFLSKEYNFDVTMNDKKEIFVKTPFPGLLIIVKLDLLTKKKSSIKYHDGTNTYKSYNIRDLNSFSPKNAAIHMDIIKDNFASQSFTVETVVKSKNKKNKYIKLEIHIPFVFSIVGRIRNGLTRECYYHFRIFNAFECNSVLNIINCLREDTLVDKKKVNKMLTSKYCCEKLYTWIMGDNLLTEKNPLLIKPMISIIVEYLYIKEKCFACSKFN